MNIENLQKPSYRKNGYGVKSSYYKYRNINGKHFKCITANSDDFEMEIARIKNDKRSYRFINHELYEEIPIEKLVQQQKEEEKLHEKLKKLNLM